VDDYPYKRIDVKRAASKLPLLILEILSEHRISRNPCELNAPQKDELDVGRSFQSMMAMFGTPLAGPIRDKYSARFDQSSHGRLT